MGRPLYIDDTEKLFGSKTPNMPPVPPSWGGAAVEVGAVGVEREPQMLRRRRRRPSSRPMI